MLKGLQKFYPLLRAISVSCTFALCSSICKPGRPLSSTISRKQKQNNASHDQSRAWIIGGACSNDVGGKDSTSSGSRPEAMRQAVRFSSDRRWFQGPLHVQWTSMIFFFLVPRKRKQPSCSLFSR